MQMTPWIILPIRRVIGTDGTDNRRTVMTRIISNVIDCSDDRAYWKDNQLSLPRRG
jgi:hypothetical protein